MSLMHVVTLDDVDLLAQEQFGNHVRAADLHANVDRTRVVELFECDEGVIERTLPFDEVLYCLAGEERVEDLDTGDVHVVKEGDMIFYTKGSRVRVTYVRPFRGVFVFTADPGVRIDEYSD